MIDVVNLLFNLSEEGLCTADTMIDMEVQPGRSPTIAILAKAGGISRFGDCVVIKDFTVWTGADESPPRGHVACAFKAADIVGIAIRRSDAT